jgi:hypothetical protein
MKAKVTLGTGILVMLAVFATIFAFMNYNRVQVWPFRAMYPVTIVIVASFGLGLAFGVLSVVLFGHFKSRREGSVIEAVQSGQRDTPGRP